jgi:hypothetical protein
MFIGELLREQISAIRLISDLTADKADPAERVPANENSPRRGAFFIVYSIFD